eukprot:COSAG05_NODE_2992_length_2430_cov_19.061776_1_plen_113_part_00
MQVAEKVLADRQRKGRAELDLLEAEGKTLRDRKANLVRQLKNEKIKQDRALEKHAAAEVIMATKPPTKPFARSAWARNNAFLRVCMWIRRRSRASCSCGRMWCRGSWTWCSR